VRFGRREALLQQPLDAARPAFERRRARRAHRVRGSEPLHFVTQSGVRDVELADRICQRRHPRTQAGEEPGHRGERLQDIDRDADDVRGRWDLLRRVEQAILRDLAPPANAELAPESV
jgi:hypothetical protein